MWGRCRGYVTGSVVWLSRPSSGRQQGRSLHEGAIAMSTRRWFSVAVGAVAAVSVISAGATALAATQPTPGRHAHTNYRGNVGLAAHGPARRRDRHPPLLAGGVGVHAGRAAQHGR